MPRTKEPDKPKEPAQPAKRLNRQEVEVSQEETDRSPPDQSWRSRNRLKGA
jgi:hypothetical protein